MRYGSLFRDAGRGGPAPPHQNRFLGQRSTTLNLRGGSGRGHNSELGLQESISDGKFEPVDQNRSATVRIPIISAERPQTGGEVLWWGSGLQGPHSLVFTPHSNRKIIPRETVGGRQPSNTFAGAIYWPWTCSPLPSSPHKLKSVFTLGLRFAILYVRGPCRRQFLSSRPNGIDRQFGAQGAVKDAPRPPQWRRRKGLSLD